MITAKFPRNKVRKLIEEQSRGIVSICEARLYKIGKESIEHARLSRAYTDISGNLRSSISFCVARDGSISRIAPRKVFLNGEEGAYRAERLLKKLAASSGSSPTLYIVAAMPYARYVEATGRDVTISATILAERLINQSRR